MNRRLYRCRENRMIAGVASGVAEYFGLDPSLVRLLWLASIFFGGLGILLYIVMIVIVPLEPLSAEALAAHAASDPHGAFAGHRHEPGTGRLMTFFGFVLLLVGSLALVDLVLPNDIGWRQLWPLLFIGAGGFLLYLSTRRSTVTAEGPAAAPPTVDGSGGEGAVTA